jgi:hypothetical protein
MLIIIAESRAGPYRFMLHLGNAGLSRLGCVSAWRRSILPLTRFRTEQCRHNIRQAETVRNVLLVVFFGRNSPRATFYIASTNLFAEIDADALRNRRDCGKWPVDKTIA